jgi:hypothetical protein
MNPCCIVFCHCQSTLIDCLESFVKDPQVYCGASVVASGLWLDSLVRQLLKEVAQGPNSRTAAFWVLSINCVAV